MNNPYKFALEYMESQRVNNTTNKFNNLVKVVHGDGSVFSLESAYTEEKIFNDIEMLLVYTEHCGYFAFYKDDVEHWNEFKYQHYE